MHDTVDSDARVCANFLLDYDAATQPGVKAKSLELAIASARVYAEHKAEMREIIDTWRKATA